MVEWSQIPSKPDRFPESAADVGEVRRGARAAHGAPRSPRALRRGELHLEPKKARRAGFSDQNTMKYTERCLKHPYVYNILLSRLSSAHLNLSS